MTSRMSDVVLAGCGLDLAGLAILDHVDGIAELLEPLPNEACNRWVVFDDEQSHLGTYRNLYTGIIRPTRLSMNAVHSSGRRRFERIPLGSVKRSDDDQRHAASVASSNVPAETSFMTC
jgi:hypothetical protein